jgi:hypothetical protein
VCVCVCVMFACVCMCVCARARACVSVCVFVYVCDRLVRAQLYKYDMTRPYWGREREAPGGGGRLMPSLSPSNCSQWWTRQLVGEYFPAIER